MCAYLHTCSLLPMLKNLMQVRENWHFDVMLFAQLETRY